jgi:hypothetical protein
MKKVLATLLLGSGALFAADTSLTFPERKFELPSLSLAETAKQVLPPAGIWSTRGGWFLGPASAAALEESLVSKMRIINPPADIDPKILKAPDSSVDFKLIVKRPQIGPAK